MKRHLCLSIFIGSLLTLSAHATSAAPLAVSTFNTDTEGWTIFGDATGPVFEAAAGNPPGDIIATDLITGIVWFFNAPAKFLGDKSAASLQTLTFDLSQSLTDSQFNSEESCSSAPALRSRSTRRRTPQASQRSRITWCRSMRLRDGTSTLSPGWPRHRDSSTLSCPR